MDSRQLRYFAAVYEQRNLSRAASLCNIAQSAVSHHISNLEAEFDTALFLRQRRGMEPTAAGERLYQHAKAILRAIAAAERDIKQSGQEISGEIAVGMAYSAMKAIGLPLMKTVLHKHPKVKLSLSESLSSTALVQLNSAEVDLALAYNPPREKQLLVLPVLEERMYCIGTREVIGDTDEPIHFEDMLRLPIVLLRQGIASRALLDDPVMLRKLEAKANLQVNSIYATAGTLLAGLGCAIATRLVMREQLADGSLHARTVINPDLYRTLYLCRLADQPATFLMEAMQDLVLGLVSREVEQGTWQARLLLPR